MGRHRSPSRLILAGGIAVGLGLLTLITLADFAARLHWLLELASHFHPHALLAALGLGGMALLAHWRKTALFALGLALCHAVPIAPYWLTPTPTAPAGLTLRVLTANLRAADTKAVIFQAILQEEQPDILMLAGLPPNLPALLGPMRQRWPHVIVDRGGSGHDLALFSRWPIQQWDWDRKRMMMPVEPDTQTLVEYPVLTAEICLAPGRCLTLIGTHTARPYARRFTMQNWQLDRVAERARAARFPVVAMGDFNMTPWSPRFGDLLARGTLRDAMLGLPPVASYQHSSIWLGLPIDHVLIGPGLTATSFRPARFSGGVHRAVLADLVLHSPSRDGPTHQ